MRAQERTVTGAITISALDKFDRGKRPENLVRQSLNSVISRLPELTELLITDHLEFIARLRKNFERTIRDLLVVIAITNN